MTKRGEPHQERSGEDPVVVLQRIYPALVTMATSLIGRDEAEDAVQEALVEVLARYPRFDGLKSPLSYTKVVLARLAYRRWRRPNPPTELSETLTEDGAPDFTDNVVLRHVILAAMQDLPRRQRTCVYLRFIEDLDDRQIGRVLGCRPVTVRTQVARALRSLRPLLVGEGVTDV